MKELTIKGPQNPERGLAKTNGLLQHRVEHRRQVAGRGVNDAKNLGCGGLLLQRLARLCDQPRILHCDDRLSGEVLEKGNLLLRERANLLAVGGDGPEYTALFAQRHGDYCARAFTVD